MKKRPLQVLATALLILAVGTSACGRETPARVVGPGQVHTAGVTIPAQILGLEVRPEDVAEQFADTEQSYVESLGLFSLRENDLVRATLQVSRLNRLADPEDRDFRNSVINRLGTTRPRAIRVGETTVYATTGTDQVIFAWFDGRGFFVLTCHRDYEFPRTLLRRGMELMRL